MPVLGGTLGVLLLLEVTAVTVGPMVGSDSWYLHQFLPDGSTQTTEAFLRGDGILLPDSLLGWRNKPNVSEGNWIIDQNGSRSTHDVAAAYGDIPRVLFLGSSMVNGATRVSNNETISAFLEQEAGNELEALNFGTMLYSMDQIFLAYKNQLHVFQPDIVVVGLDADPVGGLRNRYIPFRYPREKNMPFLKPRFFESSSGGLRMISVEVSLLESVSDRARAMLSFPASLKGSDEYFEVFSSFRRFGMTPISAGGRWAFLKFKNFRRRMAPSKRDAQLLLKLAHRFVAEARRNGASVVFLVLPDAATVYPPSYERVLPDQLTDIVQQFQHEGLTIIDGRQSLRTSDQGVGKLFQVDGVHYTSLGNAVLAHALYLRMGKELSTLRGPAAESVGNTR